MNDRLTLNAHHQVSDNAEHLTNWLKFRKVVLEGAAMAAFQMYLEADLYPSIELTLKAKQGNRETSLWIIYIPCKENERNGYVTRFVARPLGKNPHSFLVTTELPEAVLHLGGVKYTEKAHSILTRTTCPATLASRSTSNDTHSDLGHD